MEALPANEAPSRAEVWWFFGCLFMRPFPGIFLYEN